MSEVIKKIEQEAGIVAYDEKTLKNIKTVEDLRAACDNKPSDFTLFNYPARLEFLEANGYDLTRENFVNVDLSARQPKHPR